MVYYYLFVLFIAAVAASPRSQLTGDANEIQNVLQELLAPKTSHQQVRDEHDHNLHHEHEDHLDHEDHDRTNIETLNLVFKNNKIIKPGSRSKSVAGIGGDRSGQSSDMLCKLGARCGCGRHVGRCGCGRNVARCGCGRSGDGPCNIDHDHTSDNSISLKPNPYYTKAEASNNHNSNLNGKKNRADPTIVKLLDDLENNLLIQSNGNQNMNDLGLVADYDDHRDHNHDDETPDGNMDAFLKDLEKSLDDPEKNDDENVAHLRCCRSCTSKSYYRSGDDDKAYLRCCKKCGKGKSYRSDGRDRRDRSDTSLIDRAKIFQISDDLDAVVLDDSDVNNVLKLLNNGNNLDNSNSITEYVRAVNAELDKPKSIDQDRLLSPTIQQKMKVRDMYRRSGKTGGGQYGVPFELDIQGLGQVNP